MPKVSIVIPVYRIQTDFLEKCIKSVLDQTERDLQIILVCDGSTEENVMTCREFAANDQRVQVISHENKGVSVCRNEGIQAAHGDWVAFVDADDWLEPSYINTLLDTAEKYDADIALCDCFVDYSSREIENHFFRDGLLDSASCGKERFFMQFLCPRCFHDDLCTTDSGAPWCKLYRRSFIERNGLSFHPQLRRMQDNVFNLYAYEAAHRLVYADKPLYHYRKSTSSGMTRYNPDITDIYDLVFREIERFLQETNKGMMYWQGFYAKIIFSFYVILKIELGNKNNPLPYVERRKKAKDLLHNKWYTAALRQIKGVYLTPMERVFAAVMRLGWIDFAFLMYYVKEWLWHRLGKGTA